METGTLQESLVVVRGLLGGTDSTGWKKLLAGCFHAGWPCCAGSTCATGGGGCERRHTEDLHLAVRDDGLDLSLLLEVLEALAGQGAVDLEPVDEGGDGDETVGLDVLVQLVGGGLVEDDGVLRLVLDCSRLLAGDAALEGEPRRDAADSGGCASDARQRGVRDRRHRAIAMPTSKISAPRAGDGQERHHVHVPFPLDHFFFCFFAPVAAGAILTDLLGVRWDVDGWSVDCLKRAGRSGSSKKKGRLPNPYQSVHRTTHSPWPGQNPEVVHSHPRYSRPDCGRQIQAPKQQRRTTAPHLAASPNEANSGPAGPA